MIFRPRDGLSRIMAAHPGPSVFDGQVTLKMLSSRVKELISEVKALQAQYGSSAVALAELRVGKGNVFERLIRLGMEISTITDVIQFNAIEEKR